VTTIGSIALALLCTASLAQAQTPREQTLTPPALVETLKYTLTDKGSGTGELRLEWEQHVATVPIHIK
jgi:hypothetical protein